MKLTHLTAFAAISLAGLVGCQDKDQNGFFKGEDNAGERVKNLKQVGDQSLYVAGFFAESLSRSLVDVDYYVGIGQNAYAQLARQLGGQKTITEVYTELAEKFPKFVDVLAEVRKRTAISELNGSQDVGKLYEIWLRTREEWIEKKLRALGVLVDVDKGIQ